MQKCLRSILAVFVLAGVVYGQEVVTDPDKRYSVDVPKGWTVEARKDDIDLKLGQVTICVYPASDCSTEVAGHQKELGGSGDP